MRAYVIDKDNTVIEQRPSLTQEHKRERYRLVMAFDPPGKDGQIGSQPYDGGKKIPATSILNAGQLIGVLSAVKAHVTNCLVAIQTGNG